MKLGEKLSDNDKNIAIKTHYIYLCRYGNDIFVSKAVKYEYSDKYFVNSNNTFGVWSTGYNHAVSELDEMQQILLDG